LREKSREFIDESKVDYMKNEEKKLRTTYSVGDTL
jgi:hypothetical protein